jgi:hypothetical protein
MAKKTKKFVWKNSKAKALLKEDFVKGLLPLEEEDMTPEQVFLSRPEYSSTDWKLFPARMRGLRTSVKSSLKDSADDAADLAHDRLLYPESEFEIDGSYKWHGSAAETLLKEDANQIVQDGRRKHIDVKPLKLWLTRIEYKRFHPDKFANHFYQAFKRIKFDNFVEGEKEKQRKKLESEDDA